MGSPTITATQKLALIDLMERDATYGDATSLLGISTATIARTMKKYRNPTFDDSTTELFNKIHLMLKSHIDHSNLCPATIEYLKTVRSNLKQTEQLLEAAHARPNCRG